MENRKLYASYHRIVWRDFNGSYWLGLLEKLAEKPRLFLMTSKSSFLISTNIRQMHELAILRQNFR